MERLEVKGLNHSFGFTKILHDINFTLNKGEVLSIVGPSGGGKTTLLHLCAGLLDVQEGSVTNRFKSSAFAFQEARLLPWKNVIDNISMGLLANGEKKSEAIKKAIIPKYASVFPPPVGNQTKSAISFLSGHP